MSVFDHAVVVRSACLAFLLWDSASLLGQYEPGLFALMARGLLASCLSVGRSECVVQVPRVCFLALLG